MAVDLRTARLEDAAGLARVHVDSWRSTYAGIVAADYLAALSYTSREAMWAHAISANNGQRLIQVAETAAGQLIGFLSAGPVREDDPIFKGEIYALYLLQEYQRQGIGRQLCCAATSFLQARGITTLLVWVLADNPACGFYAALGGQIVRQKEIHL